MVVLAAQGVGDKLILPHLGSVFRHPRYSNFSIEEWVLVPISELAGIFRTASKHCLNAYHFHYFLVECMNNGPPLCLHDITCFRGFSKKSGCLYLKAIFNFDFGIPTDSHVYEASLALGWIQRGANEELASYMLELWVPLCCWEYLNVWLAGIRQMLSIDPAITAKLMACSKFLGVNHFRLLSSITPKSVKSTNPLQIEKTLLQVQHLCETVIASPQWQSERLTSPTEHQSPRPARMLQQDIRDLFTGS
jgi:hypothetical protein